MKESIFKYRALAIILAAMASFFSGSYCYALEDSVTVAASVTPKVSVLNSRVELSARETLADPKNHPILLSVFLFDQNGQALNDVTVECNSNRGNIDIIELFSSNGRTLLNTNSGKTNAQGQIRFRLSSYIPGNATISVMADTIVALPQQNIKFNNLPFPGNVEVSVPLPPDSSGRNIVIIPGESDSGVTSQAEEAARQAANIGTVIYIPFWLFLLIIFLIILIPILIILIFIMALKSKKRQQKEINLLEQITRAEHIDQIKYYVDQNHPHG